MDFLRCEARRVEGGMDPRGVGQKCLDAFVKGLLDA